MAMKGMGGTTEDIERAAAHRDFEPPPLERHEPPEGQRFESHRRRGTPVKVEGQTEIERRLADIEQRLTRLEQPRKKLGGLR